MQRNVLRDTVASDASHGPLAAVGSSGPRSVRSVHGVDTRASNYYDICTFFRVAELRGVRGRAES